MKLTISYPPSGISVTLDQELFETIVTEPKFPFQPFIEITSITKQEDGSTKMVLTATCAPRSNVPHAAFVKNEKGVLPFRLMYTNKNLGPAMPFPNFGHMELQPNSGWTFNRSTSILELTLPPREHLLPPSKRTRQPKAPHLQRLAAPAVVPVKSAAPLPEFTGCWVRVDIHGEQVSFPVSLKRAVALSAELSAETAK